MNAAKLVLMLFFAVLVESRGPSTIVVFNASNVTATLGLSSSTVAPSNANTKGSGSLPKALIKIPTYPFLSSNGSSPPSSAPDSISIRTSVTISSYIPTRTADTYRFTTITFAAPRVSCSSSNSSISTATSTVYIYSKNTTDHVSSQESSGASAAETWLSIISDVIDICHPIVNIIVVVLNIKMTMRLRGELP